MYRCMVKPFCACALPFSPLLLAVITFCLDFSCLHITVYIYGTFVFALSSGSQDGGSLKSPSVSRGSQRYVIDGLSEKSSVVAEPWERLLDIIAVVGARCEWQGDKGQRYLSVCL